MERLKKLKDTLIEVYNAGTTIEAKVDSEGDNEPILIFEKAGVYDAISVILDGNRVLMDISGYNMNQYLLDLRQKALDAKKAIKPKNKCILFLSSQISYEDIYLAKKSVGILSGLEIEEVDIKSGDLYLNLALILGYDLGKQSGIIANYLKGKKKENSRSFFSLINLKRLFY